MSLVIEGIFRDGVIRPKHPVALEEGAEVRVTIDVLSATPATPTPPRPDEDAAASTVDDPFAAVIGICTDGPDYSIAEHHDSLLYGPLREPGE